MVYNLASNLFVSQVTGTRFEKTIFKRKIVLVNLSKATQQRCTDISNESLWCQHGNNNGDKIELNFYQMKTKKLPVTNSQDMFRLFQLDRV